MTNLSWTELNLLFLEYRNGESKSVTTLFENLHFILVKFCHFKGQSQDSNDICQQVLLKIHIARDDYDSSKNFKTWIFSITQNAIIDHWRKNKEKGFAISSEDAIDDYMDDIKLESDIAQDKDELNKILETLSPLDQNLIKLFYVEEFTAKEMTEILSMKESAIKVKIFRILKKIRTNNEYN